MHASGFFTIIAGFLGFGAVLLGAIGAHALNLGESAHSFYGESDVDECCSNRRRLVYVGMAFGSAAGPKSGEGSFLKSSCFNPVLLDTK